jgi:sulfide:quinone oxidoreductase
MTRSSGGKTVLVLGGGVGGVVTAVELRRKLGRRHRVVLIDREANHVFSPSFLWLMTGRREAEKISRPLERLERRGIEVVRGEIEAIEPADRRVVVAGRVLEGDYLVVALGADLAPEAIPGLPEAGHDLYALSGAEGLRDAFADFGAGRLTLMTAAPAYKCPAAPYEAVMLLEAECRKRGIRDHVQVDLYAAEPGPMGVAGPEVSAAVRGLVEGRGIGFHPEHQVTEVDPVAHRISFANGAHADYDLLAYVPPHRAPKVVAAAGMTGADGWVPVDRHTLETSFPGVFAIGDVTTIPLLLGKPLPKAGVFADGQARVVAQNIAHALEGRGHPARFDGHGACFIETGDGKAGFGSGDFYAEPTPRIRLSGPGRLRHLAKVLFEKRWLGRWF